MFWKEMRLFFRAGILQDSSWKRFGMQAVPKMAENSCVKWDRINHFWHVYSIVVKKEMVQSSSDQAYQEGNKNQN